MNRFYAALVLIFVGGSLVPAFGGENGSEVCKRNKGALRAVAGIQRPVIRTIGPIANKLNESWVLTICAASDTETEGIRSLGVFLSKGKKDYVLGAVLPYLPDSNTQAEHYSSTSPVRIVSGQMGKIWLINRTDSSRSYGDINGYFVQLFSVFGLTDNGPDKLYTLEGYSGGGDGGQYSEKEFKFMGSDKGELIVEEISREVDVTVNSDEKWTTRYVLREKKLVPL